MNGFFYLTTAIAISSAVGLLALLLLPRSSRPTRRRILQTTRPIRELSSRHSGSEQFKQYLGTLAHRVRVRLGGSESANLRDRIIQAGYRGMLATDVYIASRVLGPIVGLALGSLIQSNRGFWMIAIPAVAYLLPDILLQRMVRQRREKIRRSLPDTIDLLVICVEAGLGLDQALLRVAQELQVSHPEITAELQQINREQRAGRQRIDAWNDLLKRVELPDLNSFVNMLIQTERFGTPVAKALSNFAEGLRLKRRQAAEEMAAKTTVKIIFPLVLFIFPSIFIVLLGPALLTIFRGLASMNQ